ncbi:MAG: hypothetical protein R2713_05425 [Ilumatobacteraceae bacterium]
MNDTTCATNNARMSRLLRSIDHMSGRSTRDGDAVHDPGDGRPLRQAPAR